MIMKNVKIFGDELWRILIEALMYL